MWWPVYSISSMAMFGLEAAAVVTEWCTDVTSWGGAQDEKDQTKKTVGPARPVVEYQTERGILREEIAR